MRFFPSDVEGNENLGFEIFEVAKTKGLALDVLNQFIGGFQFSIRVRHFQGIDDVRFVFLKVLRTVLKEGLTSLKLSSISP